MADTKQLHLNDFDPELKGRLIAAAEEDGVSLNTYAVGVLAKHFRVKPLVGRKGGTSASVVKGALVLPVPLPLYRKIHAAAVYEGSKKIVAENIFRDHFAELDAARVGIATTA